MTHADLVNRARAWLRRQGCAIVLTEFHANTQEKPDAIGWRDGLSILVECKVSRADFLADRRKSFRAEGGMGDWRYFLAPPGVAEPKDMAMFPGWGLLQAGPKNIVRVHGGPVGNCMWYLDKPFTGNHNAERRLLVSALRRLQLHHGVPELDALIHATYESKNGPAIQ